MLDSDFSMKSTYIYEIEERFASEEHDRAEILRSTNFTMVPDPIASHQEPLGLGSLECVDGALHLDTIFNSINQ